MLRAPFVGAFATFSIIAFLYCIGVIFPRSRERFTAAFSPLIGEGVPAALATVGVTTIAPAGTASVDAGVEELESELELA